MNAPLPSLWGHSMNMMVPPTAYPLFEECDGTSHCLPPLCGMWWNLPLLTPSLRNVMEPPTAYPLFKNTVHKHYQTYECDGTSHCSTYYYDQSKDFLSIWCYFFCKINQQRSIHNGIKGPLRHLMSQMVVKILPYIRDWVDPWKRLFLEWGWPPPYLHKKFKIEFFNYNPGILQKTPFGIDIGTGNGLKKITENIFFSVWP